MRGAYQHCLGWRLRLSENVNSVSDSTSPGFRDRRNRTAQRARAVAVDDDLRRRWIAASP